MPSAAYVDDSYGNRQPSLWLTSPTFPAAARLPGQRRAIALAHEQPIIRPALVRSPGCTARAVINRGLPASHNEDGGCDERRYR
jgi:hypothetical protein